jgi:L-cysteine desulfidase
MKKKIIFKKVKKVCVYDKFAHNEIYETLFDQYVMADNVDINQNWYLMKTEVNRTWQSDRGSHEEIVRITEYGAILIRINCIEERSPECEVSSLTLNDVYYAQKKNGNVRFDIELVEILE